MKTKQEQIEEIKQVLVKTCKRCRTFEEDYMQSRYAEALYNYIKEQRAQAVREFAEKLKDLLYTVYGKHDAPLGDLTAEDIACEIDELLKEYEQ